MLDSYEFYSFLEFTVKRHLHGIKETVLYYFDNFRNDPTGKKTETRDIGFISPGAWRANRKKTLHPTWKMQNDKNVKW